MLEEHHQEVESWVKSGEVQGLSFPCPLNACGTARPKARPLLRACSSPWRSELLPSAQPKWLRMAKEISPRKKHNFANSTATSSPPHRHGRATLECFLPWQPLHSYPQGQAQSLDSPSPRHEGDKSETAPAAYNTLQQLTTETWLCAAFGASFPSSPLPTPTPTWVKCGIINPSQNELVLEQWSFVIHPFLPHHFCQRCHCTSQGNTHESDWSKVPTQQWNSSPQMAPGPCFDSLHFQNRFGSLGKRLFWSTKW